MSPRVYPISTWFIFAVLFGIAPIFFDAIGAIEARHFAWENQFWAHRDAWYANLTVALTVLIDSQNRLSSRPRLRAFFLAVCLFIVFFAEFQFVDVAGTNACASLWACQGFGLVTFIIAVATALGYVRVLLKENVAIPFSDEDAM